MGTAVSPHLKNRILIFPIKLRQSWQQVQNILANTPHLVKRQATINSNVHDGIIQPVVGNQ